MASGAIRDEVEVVTLSRIQHGFQSCTSGIRDRARGQAVVLIGIVGIVVLPVGPSQSAPQGLCSLGYCVDDRWIGLQTHATLQAVDERSEEHTSELQSRGHLVCRLLLEKKKKQ